MKCYLLLLFAGLVALASAYRFSANVVIDGDPQMNGYIDGTMYYFYDEVNRTKSIMRLDLNTAPKMTEYYVYEKAIHYRHCGSCEAETYKLPPEQLYKLPSDTPVSGGTWQGCQEYNRAGSNVKKIWVDASGKPCRVSQAGSTGTRTYTFSNVDTTTDISSMLRGYTGWSCPQPSCNRMMDLAFVLDESGSISSGEWSQEINFVKGVLNQFVISATATNVGVVYFDDSSRIITYLQNSRSSIDNALMTGQRGGLTCIGCGMNHGKVVLDNPKPGRGTVSRVMITLTDGGNNHPSNYNTHLTNAANAVKGAGILSFAIGVGSYRASDLTTVASVIPGVQTVITVTGFSQLQGIINSLVQVTCQDLNPLPCGAACNGVCHCGGACACPKCLPVDRCTMNNCSSSNPGVGCVKSAVNCNTGNKCFTYSCNGLTGCAQTAVNCDDGLVCTIDSCNPTIGCLHPDKVCDDHSKCTDDTCDNKVPGGCVFTYTCDDHNMCTADFCDNKTGCYHSNIVCDDGDPCTEDLCNPASGCSHPTKTCADGNECTVDSCDPRLGCLHKQKDCDDHDICTKDGCVQSTGRCTHDIVPCDACKQWTGTCAKRPCEVGVCIQVGASGHDCNYTKFIDSNCSSGDKCIIDSCDPVTEQCSAQRKNCSTLPCKDVKCNPATGKCDYTDRDCSTTDPCWVGYCDLAIDGCRRKPKCVADKCMTATCNPSTGDCSSVPRDCNTGSMCLVSNCNANTDECEPPLDADCDDGEPCTVDTCDTVTGCVHAPNPCEDHDPCTVDICINGTGCQHPSKCDDGDFCTDDFCNAKTGECTHYAHVCEFNFTEEEHGCFEGACSTQPLYGNKHCYKKVTPSAFINVCGDCIKSFGVNKSIWNSTEASKSCVGKLTWPKFVGALSGGIIAAIVIGALVAAALLTVGGIVATRELVKLARRAQDQSAHNNPLYKDSGREMQNPAFGGK